MSDFDISGIGGQVRPTEVSEAISEISQNRTLMVEQLSSDPPVKPEMVYGLTNVEQVFERFKPKIEVEFETEDGSGKEEEISFNSLGDFGKKGVINQSPFLQDLQRQQENYRLFIKYLRSNKVLQKLLADPDSKAAYLAALQSMIKELETTGA